MNNDYSTAITAMVAVAVLLTGMVAFVLTRPDDTASKSR